MPVRDAKNYDLDVFSTLLSNANWDLLKNSEDPNVQWDILYQKILDILAVMCPLKRYKQRGIINPG